MASGQTFFISLNAAVILLGARPFGGSCDKRAAVLWIGGISCMSLRFRYILSLRWYDVCDLFRELVPVFVNVVVVSVLEKMMHKPTSFLWRLLAEAKRR
jgi:hypothetical protein